MRGIFRSTRRAVGRIPPRTTKSTATMPSRAYSLIMKEKEKLLSLDEPLKFIFSHSALREGWDNPNVFQICALRNIQTERERRQTIGRGLRLCVNQEGERLRGFEVNTLTVIARESYEEFAENLQREIEEDTGIRFGVVEPHQFAQIPVVGHDEAPLVLGFDRSRILFDHLRLQGYVDEDGRVQDSLRQAIKAGQLRRSSGIRRPTGRNRFSLAKTCRALQGPECRRTPDSPSAASRLG